METVTELTPSGSNRQYFRVQDGDRSFIRVVGKDRDENRAFIALSNHFSAKGIRVPKVLEVSPDGMSYTQEDLGDDLLYDLCAQGRASGEYSLAEEALLLRTIAALPKIQYIGAQDLDYGVCFPDREFNARMVRFDLNYFKYCFLKTTGVEFNEIRLQDDFDQLEEDLLEDMGNTFMYRDFQARNVIIKDGEPWFIDFQGGRRGPIYYDVASFVWQARARYPAALKEKLTDAYLEALSRYERVDRKRFQRKLRRFVLFRTLQVLGAYGFRGRFERKPLFLEAIPFAMDNLAELLRSPFPKYPYLDSLLRELVRADRERRAPEPAPGLTVRIGSFGFRKGIPADDTPDGGGYIFDCRSIHNPGKYEQFKRLDGRDAEVIRFLEEDGEAAVFLESVYRLVDAHVARFRERGFTRLGVSFGCTGGRHRSVYCAEHLAAHLRQKYPDIHITLTHRDLPK